MNNCSCDIEVNGAVPVHGVEYEGGFPLEIEVQCGHELLSIPADEPQSEVCLIEGGIVPDGMEVEWEQVMETGGQRWPTLISCGALTHGSSQTVGSRTKDGKIAKSKQYGKESNHSGKKPAPKPQ